MKFKAILKSRLTFRKKKIHEMEFTKPMLAKIKKHTREKPLIVQNSFSSGLKQFFYEDGKIYHQFFTECHEFEEVTENEQTITSTAKKVRKTTKKRR